MALGGIQRAVVVERLLASAEYEDRLIGRIRGLPRLHASIDGNAVWALLRLGLPDERVDRARLVVHGEPDPAPRARSARRSDR